MGSSFPPTSRSSYKTETSRGCRPLSTTPVVFLYSLVGSKSYGGPVQAAVENRNPFSWLAFCKKVFPMSITKPTIRSSESQSHDQDTVRPTGPSTDAVHAGEARQKPGNSITDPIFCSSTYSFADTQSVIDYIEQKQQREEYGRYGNPSQRVVERKLAILEKAEQS